MRLASTSTPYNTVPQLTRTCHATAIQLADKAASNLLPSPDSYPLAAYLLTLSAKESGLESASTCTSVLITWKSEVQSRILPKPTWRGITLGSKDRLPLLADGERSSLVALRATSDKLETKSQSACKCLHAPAPALGRASSAPAALSGPETFAPAPLFRLEQRAPVKREH